MIRGLQHGISTASAPRGKVYADGGLSRACESTESNERWYWPPSATAGGSPFPGPNPIQTRVSGSTGFCLDVPGGNAFAGAQLQLWTCNGTAAQHFIVGIE